MNSIYNIEITADVGSPVSSIVKDPNLELAVNMEDLAVLLHTLDVVVLL